MDNCYRKYKITLQCYACNNYTVHTDHDNHIFSLLMDGWTLNIYFKLYKYSEQSMFSLQC